MLVTLLRTFMLLTMAFRHQCRAALYCLQCAPSPESLELPGNKRQLRLTTGLGQPRCHSEDQTRCEEGRDVCVSQTLRAEQGDWWVVKGCDYGYLYDKLGCAYARVSRSKPSGLLDSGHSTEQRICVCRSNYCNAASTSRLFRTTKNFHLTASTILSVASVFHCYTVTVLLISLVHYLCRYAVS